MGQVTVPQALGHDLDAVHAPGIHLALLLIQRAHPQPVGISAAGVAQVGVLVAVHVFLGDHRAGDQREVHVGDQPRHGVAVVRHIGRQHLAHLAFEHTAPVFQGIDRQPVHQAVLLFPEMHVGVDNHGGIPPYRFMSM